MTIIKATGGIIKSSGGILADGYFDPSSVGTMKLWLIANSGLWKDAAKTQAATADDDVIYTWADRSANGYDVIQPTADNRPLLKLNIVNGYPAVRFDGTNDVLQNATKADWRFLHDGSGHTTFVVWKTTDANPNTGYGLVGTNGSASANIGYSLAFDDIHASSRYDRIGQTVSKGSGGSYIFSFFTDDNAVASQTINLTVGSYTSGATFADTFAYVDGLLLKSKEEANLPVSANDPTYGLDIGAIGNSTAPLKGDITEVIIYSPALSESDRNYVSAGLMSKYGITSYLRQPIVNWRSPDPNESRYDAFGFLLNFTRGLVLVARRATTHDADLGIIYQWKSINDGKVWTASTLYTGAVGKDSRNLAGGVVPVTNTGIVWFASYVYGSNTWDNMICLRTTDEGENWSNVATSDPAEDGFSPYGPLVQLPSGKILCSFYGGTAAGPHKVWLLPSTDDGANWGGEIYIVNTSAYFPTETAAVYLDGATDAASRLIAVARNNSGVMYQYKSGDGGATWTDMGALPFSGGTGADVSPWLLLHGGVVYLLYADRTANVIRMRTGLPDEVYADVNHWTSRTDVKSGIAASPGSGYPSLIPYLDKLLVSIYDTPQEGLPNMYVGPVSEV